jgi:hypothetical protein
MKISIFGNKDYALDSSPLKIMPDLKARFPQFVFVAEDPNESNIPVGTEWWIIDTVVGLQKVKILGLDDLRKSIPDQVSMHSFDLGTHLFWINKLHPNLNIHVIGVPPQLSLTEILNDVSAILANLSSENAKRN